MDKTDLGNLVRQACKRHGLRPDVVMCLILQESGGNTLAVRNEENFYITYLKDRKLKGLAGWYPTTPGNNGQPSVSTELRCRSQSWGLMQTMGDTARWIGGFTNPFFTALTIPEIGIDVGCRILRYRLDQERGDYMRALSRFNAGAVTSVGLRYAAEVMERINGKQHAPYIGT